MNLLKLVGATLLRSTSGFVLLLFSILAAGMMFGALIFYAENLTACTFDTQEQLWRYNDTGKESPYQSVLHGTYWAIVYVCCFLFAIKIFQNTVLCLSIFRTLTTVGYGKFSIFIIIFNWFFFLVINIVGDKFREIRKKKKEKNFLTIYSCFSIITIRTNHCLYMCVDWHCISSTTN